MSKGVTDKETDYLPNPPHPLLVEAARFKIMVMLHRGQGLSQGFFTRLTGRDVGTVSRHLTKLEEEGMVKFERGRTITGRPKMLAYITPYGKVALDEHWQWLDQARRIYEGIEELEGDEKEYGSL